MILEQPSKANLVEGGIGEVVPVELLNSTVSYFNSAVDHIEADHRRDVRGVYQHDTPRFAVASACYDFGANGPNPWMHSGYGGLLWAEGFKSPPRLTTSPSIGAYKYNPNPKWFLHWEMESTKRQMVFFGVALKKDVLSPHEGVWRIDQDNGVAELFCIYEASTPEKEGPRLLNEYMNQIQRIYIMVRQ